MNEIAPPEIAVSRSLAWCLGLDVADEQAIDRNRQVQSPDIRDGRLGEDRYVHPEHLANCLDEHLDAGLELILRPGRDSLP